MADGAFDYRAGTAPATVALTNRADLRRVSVQAGASAVATVTIRGGDTITVPAGTIFDETIEGRALGGSVVVGGSIAAYYVSWIAT